MNTSSHRCSVGLAVLALNFVACSSSAPLKKAGDGAAPPDLGGDVQPTPEANPDLVGSDLFMPDLPPADTLLSGKDTALTDLAADNDAVILADFPIGKDTPQIDLPAGSDTILADLPATAADALASDVPPGDVPPTDGVPRDGPADGFWGCKLDSGGAPACNDNPSSEAVMGTCQPDGTCVCSGAYVINPMTGRCMYPLRDASVGSDTGATAGCTGDYTACGCGCCGGVQATPRCYYPSLGETIAAIKAQDEATKSSTNCNLVGCSLGIHYVCCAETAPESPSSATYVATGYSGGLDHLSISKSGNDCATVSFARPMSSASSWLEITTPSSWGVSSAGFGTCGDAGATDQAKGAVGTLALRASGSQCVADLHATLFAFAADGTVRTSRLDVDGIVVTGGLPGGLCH
jgi:hypothetical protein